MSVGPAALGPGSRVGPYRLEEALGEGAAGVVYRAVAPDGGEVALKVFRAELTRDDAFRARLSQEVRAARELHHPHLVPLIDAGEADGVSFIASGYIAGSETLGARIERSGPLAPGDVARLASQLGSALDAMHAAGMVHRDVKPSNVILAGDDALLTDFGLAKGAGYTALTRPGRLLGTADYMAPELIRGTKANAATDIYALGCTLYECVAGIPPFGGRSMLAVGIAHLEEQPPDPLLARPELPAEFASALLRALAKDPVERPVTAGAYAGLVEAGAA